VATKRHEGLLAALFGSSQGRGDTLTTKLDADREDNEKEVIKTRELGKLKKA